MSKLSNLSICMLKSFILIGLTLLMASCKKDSSEDTTSLQSVTLNKTTLSLSIGDTTTLVATVSPTGSAVTWTSSNAAVLTVKNGKLTAVAAGQSTVTAAVGEKSAICTVTVTAKSNVVTFTDNSSYDIPASYNGVAITSINVSTGVSGGTSPYIFTATGLPAGITISTAGVISGTPKASVSAGTATITVKDAALKTASITINYGAIMDVVKYNLYVGGIQVTSANKANVLSDGKVSYNPTAKKLTLNGASFGNCYRIDSYNLSTLYTTDDLTIELIGSNKILMDNGGINTYGIYTTGKINITGTGTLYCESFTGSFGQSTSYLGYGIYASSVAFNQKGIVEINSTSRAIYANAITADATATFQQSFSNLYPYTVTLSDLIKKPDLWVKVTVP